MDQIQQTVQKVNALIQEEMGEDCQCFAFVIADYDSMATWSFQDDGQQGLLDSVLTQMQTAVRSQMVEADKRINSPSDPGKRTKH